MDTLFTADLTLEPLVAGHAEAMFELLSAPDLYRYLDYGPPPSLDHLRGVYEDLEARVSPDGSQLWLNWVIRPRGVELRSASSRPPSGAPTRGSPTSSPESTGGAGMRSTRRRLSSTTCVPRAE